MNISSSFDGASCDARWRMKLTHRCEAAFLLPCLKMLPYSLCRSRTVAGRHGGDTPATAMEARESRAMGGRLDMNVCKCPTQRVRRSTRKYQIKRRNQTRKRKLGFSARAGHAKAANGAILPDESPAAVGRQPRRVRRALGGAYSQRATGHFLLRCAAWE